jgi:hypothetical protein
MSWEQKKNEVTAPRPFLNSTLCVVEWPASCADRSTRERAPGAHLRGSTALRAGLDTTERKKNLYHCSGRPSCNIITILTSLCWLQYCITNICKTERDSSVGIATDYGLDDQGGGGGSSSPGMVKNFHFSVSSRPALGSTQPPIKWVPGVFSRG